MKKRMLSQDIAKGIAILAVVGLHGLQGTKTMYYTLGPITGFIMPFFIFMTGYNHHPKAGMTPWQTAKKRVLAILKVYAGWTIGTMIVMTAWFLIRKDATLPEIMKSFAGAVLSESGCKMIGWQLPISLFQHVLAPLWFLQYLICASLIFYPIVDYALRSVRNLFSVVLLLLGITFSFVCFGIQLPWGIHCAPALAAVMLLGAQLGRENRFFAPTSRPAWAVLNTAVSFVIVNLIQFFYPSAGILGAGLLGEVAGPIEILFLCCFAVFGSYFLIHLGKLIERIPVLSRCLIWFGQHSLIILCLHRPLAYLIRDVMGLPHFISGNPLYVDSITTENLIAYLLVYAIMIPVIMAVDRLTGKARMAG